MHSHLRVAALLALPLCLASCSSDGKGQEPRAFLSAATKAMDQLDAVAYEFGYEGYGSMNGNFVGEVKLQKGSSPGESKIWISMEIPDYTGETLKSHRLIIATDGKRIQTIDEREETYYHGSLADGAGHLMAYAYYGVLFQFLQPDPFEPELSGGPLQWVKQKRVKAVDCDVIRASNDSYGGADVWWYLGLEDHIPRAQKWVVTTPGVHGGFLFLIKHLNTNPHLEDSDFELEVPVGFSKIDEDQRKIAVGVSAPDWHLYSAFGDRVRLSSLRGNVVVLDMWASWCPPCWRLMPSIEEVAREYEDRQVKVLGINTWENPQVDPLDFVERKGLQSYEILLHGEEIASSYKVGSLPALFVIGPDGFFEFVQNPVTQDIDVTVERLRKAIERSLSKE